MKKGVIFNVGSGLCAYLNIDGKKVLIDCGRGSDFRPIDDFLIPIAQNDDWPRDGNGKYYLDQFILSHPHQDHIAGMEDLEYSFCPQYAIGTHSALQDVQWDKFDKDSTPIKALRRAFRAYQPSSYQENFIEGVWRIPPKTVEENEELKSENGYQNNISEVVLLNINGARILFPGDIQVAGMEYLLSQDESFKAALARDSLDFLIAPHHGHTSSFTPTFFESIKGKKTRCLNIIPEDRERAGEQHVATEYYDSDYCCGENNLDSTNGASANYGRKTSEGHICIDFEQAGNPQVKIINSTEDLLDYFVEDQLKRELTKDLFD